MERMITVHKEGEEGTLLVRHSDGRITTPLDDQPQWAEGLTNALIQERHTFYAKRLGEANSPHATTLQTILDADTVAFQDLGWLGVNAEQQEVELEADPEFRSEAMAKILGIDTEEGTMGAGVTADREVESQNNRMTGEQASALTEGMQQGFGGKREAENEKARASR